MVDVANRLDDKTSGSALPQRKAMHLKLPMGHFVPPEPPRRVISATSETDILIIQERQDFDG